MPAHKVTLSTCSENNDKGLHAWRISSKQFCCSHFGNHSCRHNLFNPHVFGWFSDAECDVEPGDILSQLQLSPEPQHFSFELLLKQQSPTKGTSVHEGRSETRSSTRRLHECDRHVSVLVSTTRLNWITANKHWEEIYPVSHKKHHFGSYH